MHPCGANSGDLQKKMLQPTSASQRFVVRPLFVYIIIIIRTPLSFNSSPTSISCDKFEVDLKLDPICHDRRILRLESDKTPNTMAVDAPCNSFFGDDSADDVKTQAICGHCKSFSDNVSRFQNRLVRKVSQFQAL
eukprot:m.235481 g.235481  ORF g.235481 m.235481 type:complete len:135 (-) comp17405_c0_seq2:1501-1905(-)